MALTMIITMAGRGQRFRDAGYTVPKYMIPAHGRTLFDWSILSLQNFIAEGARFIFIARAEDAASEFIHERVRALGISSHRLLEIDHTTDGQATTAMLAAGLIADPAEPIAIYNIDTYVDPRELDPAAVKGDGWIPCFQGQGDSWSFCRTEADDDASSANPDRVTGVAEKRRISPHATAGLYYFSSFDLYRRTYDRYYDPARPEYAANIHKGERYIVPMYRDLLAGGQGVYIQALSANAIIQLGVPDDVAAFIGKPLTTANFPQVPASLIGVAG